MLLKEGFITKDALDEALALAGLGMGAVLILERVASRAGGATKAVSAETGSASA